MIVSKEATLPFSTLPIAPWLTGYPDAKRLSKALIQGHAHTHTFEPSTCLATTMLMQNQVVTSARSLKTLSSASSTTLLFCCHYAKMTKKEGGSGLPLKPKNILCSGE